MNKLLPMRDTNTMRRVRENIEEALFIITKGAFHEGASVRHTRRTIDNLIDFCEAIDVYDEGELRDIYLNMLEVEINENRKKEH